MKMLSKTSEYRSVYEKKLRKRNSEYAERQLQNRRDWGKKNPEKVELAAKNRLRDPYCRARDKLSKTKHRLRTRYGLSIGELLRYLQKQDGKCAICTGELDSKFEVDHDHNTKEVRGLLHKRCNLFLGQIEAWPEFPRLAVEYLERFKNERR